MFNLLRTSLFTVIFCLLGLNAFAVSGPVRLNVDIPAGQWKGARLRNLPKDAVVAVQVESDGDILVALLDAASYQASPDKRRPLFTGRVEKRLSFSVTIQTSGDHYLVFDNRSGTQTRALTITVRAARGSGDQMEAANKILRMFERQLHRIFVFNPFPMGVKQCGSPKAFADGSGIVLCAEYVHHLYDIIGDQEKTKDALSFSIFHEIGGMLLSRWNHPFSSNIEVADEFATVLMVMVKHKKRAAGAARYLMDNPTKTVMLKKLFQDERHPLTVKRARNVLRWLKDQELVRSWQKTLVPHMQTALLNKLKVRPTPWTDLSLIEKELAKREKKPI
ncbi:MAG: DUF4344 domain-containing metallopeptidase [Desulfobacteraceae bacterium]|jgi:hypothetical protein